VLDPVIDRLPKPNPNPKLLGKLNELSAESGVLRAWVIKSICVGAPGRVKADEDAEDDTDDTDDDVTTFSS
jgi:hypothetical protein